MAVSYYFKIMLFGFCSIDLQPLGSESVHCLLFLQKGIPDDFLVFWGGGGGMYRKTSDE